jgi:hypothetical protein
MNVSSQAAEAEPALGPVLHRRQLVIGPDRFEAAPGWPSFRLDADTVISHCRELRVRTGIDRDGGRWALAGLAVATVGDAPDPVEQIALHPSDAVPDLRHDWAGRWLLIGNHQVHLDASGLLGCFYGVDEHGRTWGSSSPALIASAVTDGRAPAALDRELHYDRGLSWYLPPRSRFVGISRLLPSQLLDLDNGLPRARRLLPPINPDRGYEQSLQLLADALVTAMKRLPRGGPVWIALTSGLDSRAVLAATVRAETPFVPFTYVSARTSPGDLMIPPRLARAVDAELRLIRVRRRVQRSLARQRVGPVMTHCAGHVSRGDAEPLLHGFRDRLLGVSAGGWAFGVGKATSRDLPSVIEDPAADAARIAARLGEPLGSTAVDELREWLQWVLETPEEHLDWRDRFYIEQRLAGWQSSKEQVHDMGPLERFPPVNAARCYGLMLEVDEAARAEQRHQVDLVRRLCPALAGFPANPSDAELGRGRVLAVTVRRNPAGSGRLLRRWLRRLNRRK